MFLMLFLFSEKADWEKKLKISMDTQKKLEEQKQTDNVKVQEFEVSRTQEKPRLLYAPIDLLACLTNGTYVSLPLFILNNLRFSVEL